MAPAAAYAFCSLCQASCGTPVKNAATGWYCRPACSALTRVAGLAAWKFSVFTVQPTAAAAAFIPVPS